MQQFFVWIVTQIWLVFGRVLQAAVDWVSDAWDFVVDGFATLTGALREWLNGQMPQFVVDAVTGSPLEPFVDYFNLFAWLLPLNLVLAIIVNTYAATATIRLTRHLLGLYPGSMG